MTCQHSSGIPFVARLIAALAALLGAAATAAAAHKPDVTVVPEAIRSPHGMPQPMPLKTNPLFGIALDGVDALHLAYDGEKSPAVVLSNKAERAVALTGAVTFSPVGGGTADGFALPVDAAFAPDATLRLPIRRHLKKGAWHVTAECETADRRGTACGPSRREVGRAVPASHRGPHSSLTTRRRPVRLTQTSADGSPSPAA